MSIDSLVFVVLLATPHGTLQAIPILPLQADENVVPLAADPCQPYHTRPILQIHTRE